MKKHFVLTFVYSTFILPKLRYNIKHVHGYVMLFIASVSRTGFLVKHVRSLRK